MSQIRINFLNYNPDLEDTENQGLTIAQNVIHDVEGYKPVHLGTSTAFATTGGLAASTYTVTSCVAKPVGAGSDLFTAWMANDTLHVGLNGVTATTAVTGYPLSFATTGSTGQFISALDVTEYAGKIFFVVEATQGTASPSTLVSISHVGYMDY